MAQSRETTKEQTEKRKEKYGGMKRAMYLENYLVMGLLPTPMACDYKGAYRPESMISKTGGINREERLVNIYKKIPNHEYNSKNSQLNPLFVAEMMGFPPRLDDITFPKWRNESIKAYGNAVVPQLVYQFFAAIQEYENANQPSERCPGCTVCAEPCSESNHYNLPWSKPTDEQIKTFNEKRNERRPRKSKTNTIPKS